MELIVVREDVAVDSGAYDEPLEHNKLDEYDEYPLDLPYSPFVSYKALLVFAFAGVLVLLLGASMTKGNVEGQLIRVIRHAFGGP